MATKLCDDILRFAKNCNLSDVDAQAIARKCLATQVRLTEWYKAYPFATGGSLQEFLMCAGKDMKDDISHASSWKAPIWQYMYRGAHLDRENMAIQPHVFDQFCKLKEVRSKPESDQLMLFHILNSGNLLRNALRDCGIQNTRPIEQFVAHLNKQQDGELPKEIGEIIHNTTFPTIREEVQPLVDHHLENKEVDVYRPTHIRVRREAPRQLQGPADNGVREWTAQNDKALGNNVVVRRYKEKSRLTGRPSTTMTVRQLLVAALCKNEKALEDQLAPVQNITTVTEFVQGELQTLLEHMTAEQWTEILHLVESKTATEVMNHPQMKTFKEKLARALPPTTTSGFTDRDYIGRLVTAHLPYNWDSHWEHLWEMNSRIRGAVLDYREGNPALQPSFLVALIHN